MPIAALTMTATNSDGNANNRTAQLGIEVNLTHQRCKWGCQSKSLDTAGRRDPRPNNTNNAGAAYTAASDYPGKLQASPSPRPPTASPIVSTSYTLTLVNPVPMVSSAAPAQLLAGGSQTVTLTGSGFVPGTTVSFAGQTLPIGYVSYNQATVQSTGGQQCDRFSEPPGAKSGPGRRGRHDCHRERAAQLSITLTATGIDGVNTGFGEIDFSVAMSAAVTGSAQTAVNWSVAGAGEHFDLRRLHSADG